MPVSAGRGEGPVPSHGPGAVEAPNEASAYEREQANAPLSLPLSDLRLHGSECAAYALPQKPGLEGLVFSPKLSRKISARGFTAAYCTLRWKSLVGPSGHGAFGGHLDYGR